MTKRIFKYPLQITDEQTVEMPLEAIILCVQIQQEEPCLWALVDPTLPSTTRRKIRIIGTGQPIFDVDKLIYIDSIQQLGGKFMWHVFEDAPRFHAIET